MGDVAGWFFILGGFAAFVVFVRSHYGPTEREKKVGIEAPVPPDAVLDRAVEFMVRAGHPLESRTDNSATFVRLQKPSVETGIVLLLFFLLPGILYFLFGSKTVRATLVVFPDTGGSRVVVGGDDSKAKSRLTDWARGLSL